jgi:hypothetical protein
MCQPQNHLISFHVSSTDKILSLPRTIWHTQRKHGPVAKRRIAAQLANQAAEGDGVRVQIARGGIR